MSKLDQFKEEIRSKISEGKEEEAIRLLNERSIYFSQNEENELLLITRDFNDLRRKINGGQITDNNARVETNKINRKLLVFITQIKFKEESKKTVHDVGNKAYLKCDRVNTWDTIASTFDENKSQHKIQFFFIHGNEEDSPQKLAERFHYFHQEKTKFYNIPFLIGGNKLDGSKRNFKDRLFNKFNLNSSFLPNKMNLQAKHLIEIHSQRHKNESLVISNEITIQNWDDNARAMIQWMLDDFWNNIELNNNSSCLIIFISLVFSKIELKKTIHQIPYFRKRKIKQIKKEFDSILSSQYHLTKIPQLEKVKLIEINDWAEICGFNQYEKLKLRLDNFCKTCKRSKQEAVPMKLVIPELKKIIQLYQDETRTNLHR